MPVARIISSSFEDALKFADYLRPLFDTVEIAQPGRASSTAVDLVVNLQLCSPQEAWRQIAELSRQPEGEIIVAPGTLFAEGESAGGAQEIEGEGEVVEAAIALAGSDGSAAHAAQFAGIVPETELKWLGRARESLRQWLAVRALLREIRQGQRHDLALDRKRQRQMALQFERERREREARELALARAAAQPLAVVPETQTQEEPLPPEESFPTQAEQEEAIRRGLFVEEILRRRAQEQAGEATCPMPDAEPVVEFEAAPADSFLDPEPLAPLPGSRRSGRLRPAMALAGVTSVLLMAALVGYAHRRPASPVPVSVLQRSNLVEQKVPFGPASLPAPAAAPSPAGEALPSQTVLAVSAPIPERHSFRSDFRRVRVGRHEVDYVSNDVTVRHFDYRPRAGTVRHPAAPVPVTATTRGVKQISDME
jgi:hypothetical protein